jgi:hypothetical protein
MAEGKVEGKVAIKNQASEVTRTLEGETVPDVMDAELTKLDTIKMSCSPPPEPTQTQDDLSPQNETERG